MPAKAKSGSAKKKQKLLSRAASYENAMKPIVQRVLARHGRAGQAVYIVQNDGTGSWVRVTTRGRFVAEPPARYQSDSRGRVARKK